MKVDSVIVDNIRPVIELPRDLERIGIKEGGDNSQENGDDKVMVSL